MKCLAIILSLVISAPAMATDRVASASRLKMQNVAEREIMRFKNDHYLWHKHVTGVTLDPIQVLKMDLMDEHPYTLDVSTRRSRKTSTKELYNLKKLATEGNHELSILAPKEEQAKVNLRYHLDGIRSSEILSAFIATKEGKRRISDTSHEFANGSVAKVYGIMSRMDGMDTTIASVEEADDLQKDKLWGRFMLTLQGTQRLYQSTPGKIEKSARFTGVFQGADLMADLVRKARHHPLTIAQMPHMLKALGINPEDALKGGEMEGFRFYCLPVIDVHQALAVGLVNPNVVEMVRADLTHDQYLRQLLCIPTEGRNFFKERHLRMMMMRGNLAGLEPVPPIPGEVYQKRGLVVLGFDKGGHGESESASKNAAVVLELRGNQTAWLWGKEWPADADDAPIIRELIQWAQFYRFDGGTGDAFGVSLLGRYNDDLFDRRLITVDRNEFGGSSATSWEKWPIAPIRMEGFVKHQMFTSLEASIRNGTFITPYVHEGNKAEPGYDVLHRSLQQLRNMKEARTTKSYNSYQMVDKKIGDDHPDSWVFGNWGLVRRGLVAPPPLLETRTVSRASLLDGGRRTRV